MDLARSPVDRAALVVALQGVALVVLGLVYAAGGVGGAALTRTGALVGAALLAAGGALTVLVARGLRDRRTWSRSPAVVVQLLSGLVALSLAQAGLVAAAVPVGLAAVVVLYQLATPEARLELRRG